jgi:hypothetical protein
MTAASTFFATKNAIMVAMNAVMGVSDVFMVAKVVFMLGANGCFALKNAATDAKNATMALQKASNGSRTTRTTQSKALRRRSGFLRAALRAPR